MRLCTFYVYVFRCISSSRECVQRKSFVESYGRLLIIIVIPNLVVVLSNCDIGHRMREIVLRRCPRRKQNGKRSRLLIDPIFFPPINHRCIGIITQSMYSRVSRTLIIFVAHRCAAYCLFDRNTLHLYSSHYSEINTPLQ